MALQDHITKVEVEVRLKLHRNTVTRLLSQGRFPNAFRAGGRWRIPISDVAAFIDDRRAGNAEGQDACVEAS